jgi:hypothetical protein
VAAAAGAVKAVVAVTADGLMLIAPGAAGQLVVAAVAAGRLSAPLRVSASPSLPPESRSTSERTSSRSRAAPSLGTSPIVTVTGAVRPSRRRDRCPRRRRAVGARAARQMIIPEAAVERVAADLAVQVVMAYSATQQVVTAAAAQRVVAAHPADRIVALRAGRHIVPRGADERARCRRPRGRVSVGARQWRLAAAVGVHHHDLPAMDSGLAGADDRRSGNPGNDRLTGGGGHDQRIGGVGDDSHDAAERRAKYCQLRQRHRRRAASSRRWLSASCENRGF